MNECEKRLAFLEGQNEILWAYAKAVNREGEPKTETSDRSKAGKEKG